MADDSLSACLAEIKANPGKFYVYVLSRPDGTPFYVGKGQRRRIAFHQVYARLGRKSHRYSVMRKIWSGNDDVRYRIAEFFDTEADAIAAEVAIISKIGRKKYGGPLVNQTDGGDGVSGLRYVFTAEHRAKISAAGKGRRKSPEAVAAAAAGRRGKKHNAETRAKISIAVRKPEAVAKIRAARACFKHKPETIERLRLAKLGKPLSLEHRAKIAASGLGRRTYRRDACKASCRTFASQADERGTKGKNSSGKKAASAIE